MPRVYGIDIAEGNLVRNAQCLMRAQVAICVVGALISIAGLVRHFTAKSTRGDWVTRSGESDVEDMFAMDLSAILTCIIAMLLPLLLVLVVRNAIRNNSREVLVGVCIFEGVCSICAALTVLEALMAIPAYIYLRNQIDKYDCNAARDAASCEADRDNDKSYVILTIAFVIVQLILGVCEVIACMSGTVQANIANNALQTGQVFTGAPKVPVMTAVTLGQPTMVAQQDKIVQGQVVVGMPV